MEGEFVLLTNDGGQPIFVSEETGKQVADKITKRFMLLRPVHIFKQK